VSLPDLGIAFGLGLLGSIHCAQMCGPIVLSYSVATQGPPRTLMWSHACYNAGRIFTYALLGAVAGTAGNAVSLAGRVAGIEKAAMVLAGVLMLAGGAWMLATGSLVRFGERAISGRLFTGAARLLSSPHPSSKLILGMILGFLPCGLLWAALLKSAGAASALWGAATMVMFGLGTTGALAALGAFSSLVGVKLRRQANVLAAVCILIVGGLLVWRGLMAHPLGR
jgi:sulfite exporter TauE/SafE